MECINKVCVIGCGQMGRQIGLNTAIYGFEVRLTDTSPDARESAQAWAAQYLEGRIVKGALSHEQAETALEKFIITGTLEDACAQADLIIEAVVEDREVKSKLFQHLDNCAPKDAIIATNSSYMVSSMFAGDISDPGRLANMHYFNPALVMKVVEIVRGPHTSQETVEKLMDFARSTGKEPILIAKEIDGFIVNRILRAIKDEAYYLLENGIASVQDIDKGVELGLKHPMGPFRLTDFTGIDLNYMAYERRLAETGKKPPGYDIVKQKYEAGEWGKKTGKGFYEYK